MCSHFVVSVVYSSMSTGAPKYVPAVGCALAAISTILVAGSLVLGSIDAFPTDTSMAILSAGGLVQAGKRE